MTAHTPEEWRLTRLNQRIEQLHTQTERLQTQRAALSKSGAGAARRRQYLRLAHWLRAPASSLELWPVGLISVGSLSAGALLLVLVHLVTDSLMAGFLMFVVGVAAGAAALACLM